jgi:hypothetical protein
VLHTTADLLAYAAADILPLILHRNAPDASADDENPLPTTISGVPPSDTTRTGHTDDSDIDGRYVNAALLCANC